MMHCAVLERTPGACNCVGIEMEAVWKGMRWRGGGGGGGGMMIVEV